MSTETNVVEETTTGEESQPTETGDASNQSPKLENEHPFSKYLPDMDTSEFPAIHPHANIFPMVSPEEMQAGAESVKQNGLQHAILIVHIVDEYGNDVEHILDGRNRWVWCKLAGVEPRYLDVTPDPDDSKAVKAFNSLEVVIRENLTRRQLSNVDKDIIAEQMAVARRGGKQNGALTVEEAAKMMKRSASTLHKVRALKEKAPKFYAALTRKEFKNVDEAYRKAGLHKPPPTLFNVLEVGGKLKIHKETDVRKSGGGFVWTSFKTKEEAEAYVEKREAELKAEAERKAEAEQQQRDAAKNSTPPKSKTEEKKNWNAFDQQNQQSKTEEPERTQPAGRKYWVKPFGDEWVVFEDGHCMTGTYKTEAEAQAVADETENGKEWSDGELVGNFADWLNEVTNDEEDRVEKLILHYLLTYFFEKDESLAKTLVAKAFKEVKAKAKNEESHPEA